jgi:hypothetical protein
VDVDAQVTETESAIDNDISIADIDEMNPNETTDILIDKTIDQSNRT